MTIKVLQYEPEVPKRPAPPRHRSASKGPWSKQVFTSPSTQVKLEKALTRIRENNEAAAAAAGKQGSPGKKPKKSIAATAHSVTDNEVMTTAEIRSYACFAAGLVLSRYSRSTKKVIMGVPRLPELEGDSGYYYQGSKWRLLQLDYATDSTIGAILNPIHDALHDCTGNLTDGVLFDGKEIQNLNVAFCGDPERLAIASSAKIASYHNKHIKKTVDLIFYLDCEASILESDMNEGDEGTTVRATTRGTNAAKEAGIGFCVWGVAKLYNKETLIALANQWAVAVNDLLESVANTPPSEPKGGNAKKQSSATSNTNEGSNKRGKQTVNRMTIGDVNWVPDEDIQDMLEMNQTEQNIDTIEPKFPGTHSELCVHDYMSIHAKYQPDKDACVYEVEIPIHENHGSEDSDNSANASDPIFQMLAIGDTTTGTAYRKTMCLRVSINFKELNDLCEEVAKYLIKEKGIKPKDRVAIITPRGLASMVGNYAVMKAGAVAIPIDVEYKRQRVELMLKESRPKAILTTDELFSDVSDRYAVGELCRDMAEYWDHTLDDGGKEHRFLGIKNLTTSILIDSKTGKPVDPKLSSFLLHNSADPSPEQKVRIAEIKDYSKIELPKMDPKTAIAQIIFEADPSGKPKGVQITHATIVNRFLDFTKNMNLNIVPSSLGSGLGQDFLRDVFIGISPPSNPNSEYELLFGPMSGSMMCLPQQSWPRQKNFLGLFRSGEESEVLNETLLWGIDRMAFVPSAWDGELNEVEDCPVEHRVKINVTPGEFVANTMHYSDLIKNLEEALQSMFVLTDRNHEFYPVSMTEDDKAEAESPKSPGSPGKQNSAGKQQSADGPQFRNPTPGFRDSTAATSMNKGNRKWAVPEQKPHGQGRGRGANPAKGGHRPLLNPQFAKKEEKRLANQVARNKEKKQQAKAARAAGKSADSPGMQKVKRMTRYSVAANEAEARLFQAELEATGAERDADVISAVGVQPPDVKYISSHAIKIFCSVNDQMTTLDNKLTVEDMTYMDYLSRVCFDVELDRRVSILTGLPAVLDLLAEAHACRRFPRSNVRECMAVGETLSVESIQLWIQSGLIRLDVLLKMKMVPGPENRPQEEIDAQNAAKKKKNNKSPKQLPQQQAVDGEQGVGTDYGSIGQGVGELKLGEVFVKRSTFAGTQNAFPFRNTEVIIEDTKVTGKQVSVRMMSSVHHEHRNLETGCTMHWSAGVDELTGQNVDAIDANMRTSTTKTNMIAIPEHDSDDEFFDARSDNESPFGAPRATTTGGTGFVSSSDGDSIVAKKTLMINASDKSAASMYRKSQRGNCSFAIPGLGALPGAEGNLTGDTGLDAASRASQWKKTRRGGGRKSAFGAGRATFFILGPDGREYGSSKKDNDTPNVVWNMVVSSKKDDPEASTISVFAPDGPHTYDVLLAEDGTINLDDVLTDKFGQFMIRANDGTKCKATLAPDGMTDENHGFVGVGVPSGGKKSITGKSSRKPQQLAIGHGSNFAKSVADADGKVDWVVSDHFGKKKNKGGKMTKMQLLRVNMENPKTPIDYLLIQGPGGISYEVMVDDKLRISSNAISTDGNGCFNVINPKNGRTVMASIVTDVRELGNDYNRPKSAFESAMAKMHSHGNDNDETHANKKRSVAANMAGPDGKVAFAIVDEAGNLYPGGYGPAGDNLVATKTGFDATDKRVTMVVIGSDGKLATTALGPDGRIFASSINTDEDGCFCCVGPDGRVYRATVIPDAHSLNVMEDVNAMKSEASKRAQQSLALSRGQNSEAVRNMIGQSVYARGVSIGDLARIGTTGEKSFYAQFIEHALDGHSNDEEHGFSIYRATQRPQATMFVQHVTDPTHDGRETVLEESVFKRGMGRGGGKSYAFHDADGNSDWTSRMDPHALGGKSVYGARGSENEVVRMTELGNKLPKKTMDFAVQSARDTADGGEVDYRATVVPKKTKKMTLFGGVDTLEYEVYGRMSGSPHMRATRGANNQSVAFHDNDGNRDWCSRMFARELMRQTLASTIMPRGTDFGSMAAGDDGRVNFSVMTNDGRAFPSGILADGNDLVGTTCPNSNRRTVRVVGADGRATTADVDHMGRINASQILTDNKGCFTIISPENQIFRATVHVDNRSFQSRLNQSERLFSSSVIDGMLDICNKVRAEGSIFHPVAGSTNQLFHRSTARPAQGLTMKARGPSVAQQAALQTEAEEHWNNPLLNPMAAQVAQAQLATIKKAQMTGEISNMGMGSERVHDWSSDGLGSLAFGQSMMMKGAEFGPNHPLWGHPLLKNLDVNNLGRNHPIWNHPHIQNMMNRKKSTENGIQSLIANEFSAIQSGKNTVGGTNNVKFNDASIPLNRKSTIVATTMADDKGKIKFSVLGANGTLYANGRLPNGRDLLCPAGQTPRVIMIIGVDGDAYLTEIDDDDKIPASSVVTNAKGEFTIKTRDGRILRATIVPEREKSMALRATIQRQKKSVAFPAFKQSMFYSDGIYGHMYDMDYNEDYNNLGGSNEQKRQRQQRGTTMAHKHTLAAMHDMDMMFSDDRETMIFDNMPENMKSQYYGRGVTQFAGAMDVGVDVGGMSVTNNDTFNQHKATVAAMMEVNDWFDEYDGGQSVVIFERGDDQNYYKGVSQFAFSWEAPSKFSRVRSTFIAGPGSRVDFSVYGSDGRMYPSGILPNGNNFVTDFTENDVMEILYKNFSPEERKSIMASMRQSRRTTVNIVQEDGSTKKVILNPDGSLPADQVPCDEETGEFMLVGPDGRVFRATIQAPRVNFSSTPDQILKRNTNANTAKFKRDDRKTRATQINATWFENNRAATPNNDIDDARKTKFDKARATKKATLGGMEYAEFVAGPDGKCNFSVYSTDGRAYPSGVTPDGRPFAWSTRATMGGRDTRTMTVCTMDGAMHDVEVDADGRLDASSIFADEDGGFMIQSPDGRFLKSQVVADPRGLRTKSVAFDRSPAARKSSRGDMSFFDRSRMFSSSRMVDVQMEHVWGGDFIPCMAENRLDDEKYDTWDSRDRDTVIANPARSTARATRNRCARFYSTMGPMTRDFASSVCDNDGCVAFSVIGPSGREFQSGVTDCGVPFALSKDLNGRAAISVVGIDGHTHSVPLTNDGRIENAAEIVTDEAGGFTIVGPDGRAWRAIVAPELPVGQAARQFSQFTEGRHSARASSRVSCRDSCRTQAMYAGPLTDTFAKSLMDKSTRKVGFSVVNADGSMFPKGVQPNGRNTVIALSADTRRTQVEIFGADGSPYTIDVDEYGLFDASQIKTTEDGEFLMRSVDNRIVRATLCRPSLLVQQLGIDFGNTPEEYSFWDEFGPKKFARGKSQRIRKFRGSSIVMGELGKKNQSMYKLGEFGNMHAIHEDFEDEDDDPTELNDLDDISRGMFTIAMGNSGGRKSSLLPSEAYFSRNSLFYDVLSGNGHNFHIDMNVINSIDRNQQSHFSTVVSRAHSTRGSRASTFVAAGKPSTNSKVFIVDENMKPVPFGVVGDIVTLHDHMSPGYINEESQGPFSDAMMMVQNADSRMFAVDFSHRGWGSTIYGGAEMSIGNNTGNVPKKWSEMVNFFKTGDMGKIDPVTKEIQIVGRSDNMVNVSGNKIHPDEITNHVKHRFNLAEFEFQRAMRNGKKPLKDKKGKESHADKSDADERSISDRSDRFTTVQFSKRETEMTTINDAHTVVTFDQNGAPKITLVCEVEPNICPKQELMMVEDIKNHCRATLASHQIPDAIVTTHKPLPKNKKGSIHQGKIKAMIPALEREMTTRYSRFTLGMLGLDLQELESEHGPHPIDDDLEDDFWNAGNTLALAKKSESVMQPTKLEGSAAVELENFQIGMRKSMKEVMKVHATLIKEKERVERLFKRI